LLDETVTEVRRMTTLREVPASAAAGAGTAAPDRQPLLEVRNLVTEFKTRGGALRAVNDISFSLDTGRVLCVLGESGSGKSVMLRTILGIQARTATVSGQAIMRGVDLLTLSPREREQVRGEWLSMVFQDPMTALDPVFTVEQQIVETLRRHRGMDKSQAKQRARELIELVQIPSPEQRLKSYPFELSGGMRQRVVIAMALACEPSLLLADEPTTALDVTVQARVLELLKDLQRRLGMSMILVTHDLGVAAEVADDIAVMYAGRIVESGTARQVIKNPQHPYTRGLLEANVRPGQHERPEAIPGAPPNLARLPAGCSFAPRCRHAQDICRTDFPAVRMVEPGHIARCVLTEQPRSA
jgi:oligopeptide/dipeptide ABC transporter ATP-binding protein